MTQPNIRLMSCPACNGDRGWLEPDGFVAGEPIERWFPCNYCDATGKVEVVVEPIEEGDCWK